MLINKLLGKLKGRTWIFISLIVLLIFLSGCGDFTQIDRTVNYHKGRDGIEVRFLNDINQIEELYEGTSFNLNIVVENRGADTISGEEYAILTVNYDPFYIKTYKLENMRQAQNIELGTSSIKMKGIELQGKSVYYPSGTEQFITIPNIKLRNVTGQRESPKTQIALGLCYPYSTLLSEMVCVDFDVYGDSYRDQVCKQKDLSFANQGAPVAVTEVKVENQPAGNNLVKPIFIIKVKNVGSGTVLSPVHQSSAELDRVCALSDTKRQDFNTVDIVATLSDETELDCSPKPIRLYNGEGFTRCQVNNEDLQKISIGGMSNYQAPLTVNLSYAYMTSTYKDVEIKRIHYYGGSESSIDEHEEIDGCSGIGEGFSCKCGFEQCKKLNGKNPPLCYFDPGKELCSRNYCCRDECTSTEVWINGACYPKCSSQTCGSATTKDCVCGTEGTTQIVIKTGSYCCGKNPVTDGGKNACEVACSDN